LRSDPTTRDIPVMAMTASVMASELQRITGAGFGAYQGKPIRVKDFIKVVEELLRKHGKMKER